MRQELRFYLFSKGCNCIPCTSLYTYLLSIYTSESLCTSNIKNMNMFQSAIIYRSIDLTTNHFFCHDIYSFTQGVIHRYNVDISWLNKIHFRQLKQHSSVARAAAAAAAAKSLQSCPTLCDSIDGSPPGSPVPGILQARTLEWVAISFSNA